MRAGAVEKSVIGRVDMVASNARIRTMMMM